VLFINAQLNKLLITKKELFMSLVQKRHLILVKFLAILYLCCALPAKAGLLFEQLPQPFSAPVASGPSLIGVPLAIDDFIFIDDVELTELVFWTIENPNAGLLSNNVDIKMMNGLLGVPDSTPASVFFEVADMPHFKEFVSVDPLGTLFKHTLALPNINLTASTQYFLQISANINNVLSIGWQTSVSISGVPPWADFGIGGGVQPGDPNTQMAFRLNGNVIPAQTVPEPQSLALFLFAFLLLSHRIKLH